MVIYLFIVFIGVWCMFLSSHFRMHVNKFWVFWFLVLFRSRVTAFFSYFFLINSRVFRIGLGLRKNAFIQKKAIYIDRETQGLEASGTSISSSFHQRDLQGVSVKDFVLLSLFDSRKRIFLIGIFDLLFFSSSPFSTVQWLFEPHQSIP